MTATAHGTASLFDALTDPAQPCLQARHPGGPARDRLARMDWPAAEAALQQDGYAVLPQLLDAGECAAIAQSYTEHERFRSRVIMARHGFGRGEYQYFAYPLPALLGDLRTALYPRLMPVANRWNAQLRIAARYPDTLEQFLAQCHAAGQTRPTPLLLQYRAGDYNCLHRDLYGERVFPLQAAILLSRPQDDFTGGEFVITDDSGGQRSASVVPLRQGDAVVFAVSQRPVLNARRVRKALMSHGVSQVRSGLRHTVGLIFHDAK